MNSSFKATAAAVLVLVSAAFAPNASAVELKKNQLNTSIGGVDHDIEFTLTRSEVNDVSSPQVHQALAAILTAWVGPNGLKAAAVVSERAQDIRNGAGANGAWVKMTIRNGNSMHVWVIYPL